MDQYMSERLREGRNSFKESCRKIQELKNSLSKVEGHIAKLKSEPRNKFTNRFLKSQLDFKRIYERAIKDLRGVLVLFYRMAIQFNVDIDGSRLLKVYRFFYRNRAQLHRQLALINVPRGSNSLWGIIILTAVMFLYAAI